MKLQNQLGHFLLLYFDFYFSTFSEIKFEQTTSKMSKKDGANCSINRH